MDREAFEQLVECADCGVLVDVGIERGYSVGSDSALCWECAINRGAKFDEDTDTWLEPPDVADLYSESEHEFR